MKTALNLFITYLTIYIAFTLTSCANVADNGRSAAFTGPFLQYDSLWAQADKYPEKIEIRYAKGLKVEYRADGIHIFIMNPALKNGSAEEFVIKGDAKNKRFICTTALQLGNFEILGIENRIVGMNSLKNVFSPQMLNQIANGTTVKVGKEGNFDLEAVIAAKPDYIFVSASKFGGFESLRECGIPLIPHHGYRETSPLGQAEWIKLVGLLTGETKRANAIFSDIEKKYNDIKAKVKDLHLSEKKLPTILSGRQIRDGWYVMGGQSYMAKIFHDAGANYIFANGGAVANETGGIALDFESVYARGLNADFWQTDGSFEGEFTLDVLKTEDERYAQIAAFKKQQVLFCNFSQTPYRELGALEPHRILADFVKALHPEILPDYTPKYYRLIK